nr:RdRp-like protein [Aedes japonicus narnavirus 1]
MSLESRCVKTLPPAVPAAQKAAGTGEGVLCHTDPQGLARRTNLNPKSPNSVVPPKTAKRARSQGTPDPAAALLGRQAQHVWDAFRLTIWALLPRCQKRGLSYSAAATIKSIDALYQWIRISMTRSGVEWTAKQVKEYANFCRARCLEDPRTEAPRGFPVRAFERGFIKAAVKCPGKGRLALAQLARLGRAMPAGTEKVGIVGLRKHREVLSHPMDTDPELVARLRSWATQWAEARVRDGATPVVDPATSFSRSASESVSAAKGGQLRELRSLPLVRASFQAISDALYEEQGFEWDAPLRTGVPTTWDDESGEDPEAFMSTGDEVEDLRMIVQATLMTALDNASAGAPIPMTATVISELGMKARVVTKPPSWAVIAGDACRRTVWPLLEKDRRIDLSGVRPTAEALDAFHDNLAHSLVGARTPQFYSADLTAATDLMPFDVSQALWEGICDGLRADATTPLRSLGRYLLGPVTVDYPDLRRLVPTHREYAAGEVHSIVSKRGCMMGLPISWTVLNLYNLAMADFACTPEGYPTMVGVAPAIARGDDLVAAIPKDEADRYENLIALTGGEANRLKSFRSMDKFVLAERTFEVGRRPLNERPILGRGFVEVRSVSTAPLLAQFDVLPPRGLADVRRSLEEAQVAVSIHMSTDLPIRSLLGGRPSVQGGVAIPNYVAIPSSAAACLAEFEGTPMYKAVCKGLLSVHREIVSDFRKSAIPLFYPRILGGGGFPHPGGFAAAVKSAGALGEQRAGLALATHTYASRKKVGLDSDPWVPPTDTARMDLARSRLMASDARMNAASILQSHPLTGVMREGGSRRQHERRQAALQVPCAGYGEYTRGQCIVEPLEDASVREAAKISAWEDVSLARSSVKVRKYPTLGDVAKRLKVVRELTVKAKFPQRFVPNVRRMGQRGFLDRLAATKASETVLVPFSKREAARAIVFDPDRHTVPDPEEDLTVSGDVMGYPTRRRELQGREGAGVRVLDDLAAVPVVTTRSGLTLGDVAAVRCLSRRRGKRGRRTPVHPNRNGA